jgi:hypothetical protein
MALTELPGGPKLLGDSKQAAVEAGPFAAAAFQGERDMRVKTTVRLQAPIGGFRKIYCSVHGAQFRGHGTTRVLSKIVFSFCFACWHERRQECNETMKRIAGVK